MSFPNLNPFIILSSFFTPWDFFEAGFQPTSHQSPAHLVMELVQEDAVLGLHQLVESLSAWRVTGISWDYHGNIV